MALSWLVGGKDVRLRANFAGVRGQNTFLVNGFHEPFVRAIDDFFNNTPKVKNFNYVINWGVVGGIRSVEMQRQIELQGNSGAVGGRGSHNYGTAIDFAPVGLQNVGYPAKPGGPYRLVLIGAPYIFIDPNRPKEKGGPRLPAYLPEPWAVAVEALYNHPLLYSGALFSNLFDFNHIEFNEFRKYAASVAPQYWVGKTLASSRDIGKRNYGTLVGRPARNFPALPETLAAPVSTPRGPGISPFIAANDSFHPHIQYELTRRRNAIETANTYMPFINLTALVKVYNANLDTGPSGSIGAYCPTLGIHGQNDIIFDSIYYPQDGRSIVGYATRDAENGPERVPLLVASNEEDPPNIPPPGIVSMNAERTTAGGFGIRGGLFKANLNIRAHSLGQVNTLLKYFIRQGTKVVLEIGRVSSSPAETLLTNSPELSDFRAGSDADKGLTKLKTTTVKELFQKFNWQRKEQDIRNELQNVIIAQEGQRELIEKYTYNNFGNYELFIGYVATFKLKYTKENVYDIELTVHSVQQFEVPTKLGGTRSSPTSTVTVQNVCEPVDIMDYFKPESAYRDNSFLKVLGRCSDSNSGGALYDSWGAHVIPLRAGGGQAGSGGLKSNGYLISWECFVDLILNDPTYGLLGTLQLESGLDQKTISLLRSGLLSRIGSAAIGNENHINSNEVSWNKSLRSTDPNVMVIYNKSAQGAFREGAIISAINVLKGKGEIPPDELAKIEVGAKNTTVRTTIETNGPVGSFDRVGRNSSYLTKGVWINSNAIVDAFSSADTISMGITNLLNSMNNATQGYWNLQVISAEPEVVGLRVIDAGLSKPINKPIAPMVGDFGANLPINSPVDLVSRLKADVAQFADASGSAKYLYSFNRKLQQWVSDDLGSELLDINIDASMPNVIAVQAVAGVGGVAQRGVLAAIDVDELKSISMFDTYPSSTQSKNTCAESPSVLVDKNVNKTLTADEVSSITAAIKNPGLRQEEGGTDKYIETLEKAAFERAKQQREAEIKAGTIKEEDVQTLVSADIQSARQIASEQYERATPGLLGLVREFSSTFGQAIDLVENNTSQMVALLDGNKQEEEVHPFNVSNLTKTVVDLTIPGIGGILLFQGFVVDRVPNILRRGYYIVTKVAHEFSIENGWITKIQGRFRFKPKMQGEAKI